MTTIAMNLLVLSLTVVLVSVNSQSTNVRVEFDIRKFSNAKGILQTGSKCTMSCNQKVTGYIDTSLPSKPWPGTKRVPDWPILFSAKKDNAFVMNKVISADVCAGNFKEAVFRAHVVDLGMSSEKLIDDFECSSGTQIGASELKATWSEEKECTAKYNPSNNKLTYRARVYALPISSCGKPPSRQNSRS